MKRVSTVYYKFLHGIFYPGFLIDISDSQGKWCDLNNNDLVKNASLVYKRYSFKSFD